MLKIILPPPRHNVRIRLCDPDPEFVSDNRYLAESTIVSIPLVNQALRVRRSHAWLSTLILKKHRGSVWNGTILGIFTALAPD
jgi:hypothetical protein